MSDALTLEIVEGPGAGRQFKLAQATVIGRAADADLVLADEQVSRHHARVTPGPGGSATIEDLASVNGTFVNQNELIGATRIDPGDELLIGVTVMMVRTDEDISRVASAVRVIPPALASAPREPTYVGPAVLGGTAAAAADDGSTGHPTLDKYLDVRVRRRAQLAPLAVFVLVALALIVYFSVK